MSASFNEGLIERSYHALWERHFAAKHTSGYEVFVPGKEEVHVGYDLGFAKSRRNFKFSTDQFFDWMKQRIASTSRADNAILFAYFYQYKVIKNVACLKRIHDKTIFNGLTTNFHYNAEAEAFRTEIDTVRNTYNKGKSKRPFSQHEALCRLSRIAGVEVAYCTPRFLESDGIKPEPQRSLADLTLTRVDSKTPIFKDKDTHYLYFQDLAGKNAAWCSEPVAADSAYEPQGPELMTARQLLGLMKANYLQGDEGERVSISTTEVGQDDLSREVFIMYLNALPTCARIMLIPDAR